MNQTESKSDGNAAASDEAEGKQSQAEILYDRYTERARELFEAGHEKSKAAMDSAMDAARTQFAAAGEFSAEQGEAFSKFLRRDLDQTAEDMQTLRQEAQTLGQEAGERLNPSRLGAGALASMSRLLETAGSALQNLSRKAEEALQFNTGEITAAGTLTCKKCGQKVQLKRSAHIPPCPSCHGTEFRKGY